MYETVDEVGGRLVRGLVDRICIGRVDGHLCSALRRVRAAPCGRWECCEPPGHVRENPRVDSAETLPKAGDLQLLQPHTVCGGRRAADRKRRGEDAPQL